MIYEITINGQDVDVDIDTYSLLREEPEFKGIDESGAEFDLNDEQMTQVMEWFEQNKDRVYQNAFNSVADD